MSKLPNNFRIHLTLIYIASCSWLVPFFLLDDSYLSREFYAINVYKNLDKVGLYGFVEQKLSIPGESNEARELSKVFQISTKRTGRHELKNKPEAKTDDPTLEKTIRKFYTDSIFDFCTNYYPRKQQIYREIISNGTVVSESIVERAELLTACGDQNRSDFTIKHVTTAPLVSRYKTVITVLLIFITAVIGHAVYLNLLQRRNQ